MMLKNKVKSILNTDLLRLYLGSFAIIVLSYSILRGAFLYWNWGQFKGMPISDIAYAFFVGLRFDLSAIAILYIPAFLLTLFIGFWLRAEVWKKFFYIIVLLTQIPFWILNFIDIEFFNFVGRRVTVSGLFIFSEAEGKMMSFFQTYLIWILIIFFIIFLFCYLLYKLISSQRLIKESKIAYLITMFVILIPLVISARGGLQKKPIDFVYASVFNSPVLNNLILNSTFSILKSFDKDKISPVQFYAKDADYFPLLNGYMPKNSELDGKRPNKKQNVVIFILESFALEFMGYPNHQKGYTPFLDQIAQKGLFFKNSYANGRRSIEGIASIIAGIPALMSEPFISSEFASNYFLGIGTLLEPLGYATSFFHGGHNGTMYFDKFINSAGIPNYYGANEYPPISEDDDKVWGIFDEPFLKFFGKTISNSHKPFLTALFTLSSHHPYTIPEQYKGKFAKGPLEILESLQYTDHALKVFFETYQNEDWFKDTLFIFT
ncbi:MAG: sulfatase-like hydrolase/transferase, partial [Bdellovibrionales bacterium]|nr:sulfatase-like hydrolase/transferase [Bdellovibrionales bacterium]